jgi:hypothetical protein
MPLYKLSEKDLRDYCKRAVENLELWIRRLINQELIKSYGTQYLNATHPDGSRIINNGIERNLLARMTSEPKRFPTPIDAAFLDDAISILCNPELYKKHFAPALTEAFPDGLAEARTFLTRLIPIRNALSHSNSISVHDAYRILCYSHDIIQSIKIYYVALNMQQEFNVPTIVRVTDSLGHTVSFSSTTRNPQGYGMLDYSRDDKAVLHCGDTLSIEVGVDPTFDASTYEIKWLISNIGGPIITGPKFTLLLEERYVSSRFCAVCHVTSKEKWHKLGTHDDQIDIAYRVLPPV